MFLSLGIMVLHVICIYQTRLLLKRWTKEGRLKDILLDGLFAFELGCLAQEQGVVLQHYGLKPWAACLFCVVVWQVVFWPGCSSSPIPHLLTFSLFGLLRSMVMLTASLASYRYMSKIWEFELTHLHQGRGAVLSVEKCAFPFLKHSFTNLIATEFAGSLILTFLANKIFRNQFLINNDSKLYIRGCIMGVLVLAAVVLGMDISGAMYNPTLATLLLGGCRGQRTVDHVLVYWIAPTAGAWFGNLLSDTTQAKPIKLKKK